MAFIREYAAAGDPFRLRMPKGLKRAFTPPRALRKLQVRDIAHVAAPALGLIPGVGTAMNFARSYGYDLGDPAPKPGHRRKGAAAGPKHKAEKKAQKRAAKGAQHVVHGKAPKKGKKKGKGLGATLAGLDYGALAQAAASGIPIAGGVASELIGQMHGGAAQPGAGGPDFGTFDAGAVAGHIGAHGAHGFGHKRRSMNPANVHALRRSMRRMEGFERLVKRVAPHLLTAHKSHRHHSSTGGHKAGCRCAVCKRK